MLKVFPKVRLKNFLAFNSELEKLTTENKQYLENFEKKNLDTYIFLE